MNDLKLTLGVITKNSNLESTRLDNMLNSVYGHVDEIRLTITLGTETEPVCPEIMSVLEKYPKVEASYFVWCNDFAKARNYNLDQCRTELYLWLDTDDILEGCENLPKLVEMFVVNPSLNAVWINYDYDFDDKGNITCKLRRERIVRKDIYRWVGKLHENLLCQWRPIVEFTDLCNVKHCINHEELESKCQRNLDVILAAFDEEKEKGDIDPRTVYDVARAYHSINDVNNALIFYEKFITVTGSQLDLYDALIRMCGIYRQIGALGKCISYAHDAILRYYNRPEAYLELAECSYMEEKWMECVHWVDLSVKQRIENDVLPINPTNILLRPIKLKIDCLFRLNRPKEALSITLDALKANEKDPELLRFKKNIEGFLDYRDAEIGAIRVLKRLEDQNQEYKIKHLLEAIPDDVSDHPFFVRLRNKYNPKSGKNRIVIYCHESFEEWDGSSGEEGIGGSEEAVINISKEFVKLGWSVDVYNSCKKPGNYDGVNYNYFDQYDRNQECDVFIAWRLCEWVNLAPEGSLKILWCHDKQEVVYFTKDIVDKLDKIFVLSDYHRQDLPEVPDDKFFITRNGIDPEHFKGGWANKTPFSFIYASSPDRGLIHILENWETIQSQFSECELNIYYGFNKVYERLSENDPQRRYFKDKVMQLIEKYPNIHYHGKVGHKEIAKAFMKADYWLYPTTWQEISCITAMKAQAAGCWPICNDFAALKETVQWGTITPGEPNDKGFIENYLKSIPKAVEESSYIQRKYMREWALKFFSWETLAHDWTHHFKQWMIEKKNKTFKTEAGVA